MFRRDKEPQTNDIVIEEWTTKFETQRSLLNAKVAQDGILVLPRVNALKHLCRCGGLQLDGKKAEAEVFCETQQLIKKCIGEIRNRALLEEEEK